jgi:hypothetical protein
MNKKNIYITNYAYSFGNKLRDKFFEKLFGYFSFLRAYRYHVKVYMDLYNIKRQLRKIHKSFDCIIGVEKGGLICAQMLSKIHPAPYYYLSLELYTKDHPKIIQLSIYSTMRALEIAAHKKAAGTIIADESRKDHLYADGNIDHRQPAFYLPITIPQDTTSYNTMSKKNPKVILNFGYNRLPADLFIKIAENLPEDYIFLIHHLDTKHTEHYKAIIIKYSLERVKISNKSINTEEEIANLIADAFVGFCWYQAECANERLISFSSEKTARYLAAGIPIIANSATNFSQLFSQINCGIAISTQNEFTAALKLIAGDYQGYSQRAKQAFNKYYRLTNFREPLDNFLKKTIESRIKLNHEEL